MTNKTYALISNGIVVNIVVVAPDDDPGFLVVGAIEHAVEIKQVQVGWNWSQTDGDFSPPTSAEAAEAALAQAETSVIARAVARSNLHPELIRQIHDKLGVAPMLTIIDCGAIDEHRAPDPNDKGD